MLRGRERPEAMSLCYTDMRLSHLLGRPSLRHTVRASALQNSFLKNLEHIVKNFFLFFFSK